MLHAAEQPRRRRPGIAQRDRLVLMALVLTSLRRSELIAVRWLDVNLEGERPSLLVRRGKGGRPRRQPLPAQLVAELGRWRRKREPSSTAPVFCGLAGGTLGANVLTDIVRRTATPRGPLEARHGAHAAPHRRDVAAAGHGRHPTRGRVPRPRRPLDGQPLRPRGPRGDAHRGADARR